MSPAEFDRLPDDFKALFNEKRKLKRELYDTRLKSKDGKSVSREDLNALEQRLKTEVARVKDGFYKTKRQANIIKDRDRRYAQLLREREAHKKTREKYKTERARRIAAEKAIPKEKVIVLNQKEFVIESEVKMPDVLKRILDTTFEDFAQAETQFLATADEQNMTMNLNKFLEANENQLMSLTQADVDAIVDFYYQDTLSGTTGRDDARKYNAFKIYILVYLLEQSRLDRWSLTTEQVEKIRTRLEAQLSGAGTELAVWRSTMNRINPNKKILKSLERRYDIVLREEDIDALSAAIKTGEMDRLIEAQERMMKNALADNQKTRNIWEKLWDFQRTAMLSGPGTWVRNHASDALLAVGNNAAAVIGNLFVKKEYRAGQYKLVGTKASAEVKAFTQRNFYDNGFLDMVIDGLSKYDLRHKKKRTSEIDIVTEMLASAVSEKVLYGQRIAKNDTTNKILSSAKQFIMKMVSDDPWIKRKLKTYLDKMLTEDNADLSKGVSTEILTTLVEAFTLACFDYMRKPNFFTKMESELKRKHGSAAYFAYKQVLPFAAASMNWFVEGLRWGPLGLAKAIYNFVKLENTIEKMDKARARGEVGLSPRLAEYIARRDIGKGVIGSIGLPIGLLLGWAGVAWIDEEDEKLKLRVGNISLDISKVFGTQSILIGMMMTNPSKGDWRKHLTGVLEALAHESLMEDFFNMFRYNQSSGDMLLNQPINSLNMFVPNFIKTFNSMLYTHKIEYSTGFKSRMEKFFVQSVPFLAHAMPKRYDPYTGELQSYGLSSWVCNAISRLTPVKVKRIRMSDEEKEAVLYGVTKTELTGRYEDIGTLSAKDRSRLNQKYGELNSAALKQLYSNKDKYSVQMENGKYKDLTYAEMTPEQKKRVIERIMSENAHYAKIYIYTTGGGKYYATSSEYKILQRLGITKNVYKANRKLKGFV